MVMKTRSAKNKGKRLQNNIRDLILEKFQQLEEDDVRSTTMGDSGEDVLLSPAARKLFPFAVIDSGMEVKSFSIFFFFVVLTSTTVLLPILSTATKSAIYLISGKTS